MASVTYQPQPFDRITHYSESMDSVQGHGVHTAFLDMVGAQRELGYTVGLNTPWSDGVLHVHTVGPESLRRLMRHGGLRVASAHVTAGTLRGSLKGVGLYGKAFDSYVRYFYSQADVIIAVSANTAQELRDIGVRTPVEVVPNAVGDKPFRATPEQRAAARAAEGYGPDDFTVVTVGQLQPRKGVDHFVATARALPDVRFVWVGGVIFGAMSDGRSEMRRTVAERPANAHFPGQMSREGVIQHLHAADAFLFPSRHETFGMAPVEAAFAGLPVVLSDIPVFAEVFGAVPDSYLKARTTEQYVAHIAALRDNEVLRESYADRAGRAVQRYAASTVAQDVVKLYEHWSTQPGTKALSARVGARRKIQRAAATY